MLHYFFPVDKQKKLKTRLQNAVSVIIRGHFEVQMIVKSLNFRFIILVDIVILYC